jgi:glycosyltransferase involved in cell wall biosynthesis
VKIAQIAPLFESVPPRGYGGTERVVSYLTEELVAQGHDVTLFASGDSQTGARLCPRTARALRLDPRKPDALSSHLLMLEHVAGRADEFDVIHSHADYLAFPFARRSPTEWLSTLHGRLDHEYLGEVFGEYSDHAVVSISDAQRAQLPHARWARTIHHGLPSDLYTFHETGGTDLVFVGRISPEKRVDRAVEIAVRSGRRLRIAAKVDPADAEYYDQMKPLLNHPLVEFVGELGDRDKNDFLGNAAALLFPIDWPEPFGLIMIEALACGTPVIAWRHGSVAEVLTHGETGYLCDDVGEAIRAVRRIEKLERARCRAEFERRFTAARMASDYVEVYTWIRSQPRAA